MVNVLSLLGIFVAIFMIVMPPVSVIIHRASSGWQSLYEGLFVVLSLLLFVTWVLVPAAWMAYMERTDYASMAEYQRMATIVTISVALYNAYAFGLFMVADAAKRNYNRKS